MAADAYALRQHVARRVADRERFARYAANVSCVRTPGGTDRMPRTYRVAFALATVDGLFREPRFFREALLESWIPGTTVTRYSRRWILSRLDKIYEDVFFGRVGFVNEDDLTTLRYDDDLQDFVRESASSGVVVPVAMNVSRGTMAFQLVSGQVRVQSITSALKGAFNSQHTGYYWDIRELAQKMPYREWVRDVSRITSFRFRIHLPNPHWPDEGLAKALLEELRLQVATVSGKGHDIDSRDEAFQSLLNHVIERYGNGVVGAVDNRGAPAAWTSVDGGTVPAVQEVESEGEEEIHRDDLVAALESSAVTPMEVLNEDEAGPELLADP